MIGLNVAAKAHNLTESLAKVLENILTLTSIHKPP
jgi:hypothetical protein